MRCNRETPCSNCVRSKNEACVYESNSTPPPRQHLGLSPKARQPVPSISSYSTSRASTVSSYPSSSHVATSASESDLASQPSAQDAESLKSQIRQLEEQLSAVTPPSIQSPASTANPNNIDAITSSMGGTFYVHHEVHACGKPQATPCGVSRKTRLFGKSHWMNGVSLVSSCDMHEPRWISKGLNSY